MEKISVDFSQSAGKIKKELYCSGLHTFVNNRSITDFDPIFRTLRFPIVRNHDWALNDANQRLIDIHHIFPLMHLDANDERNYVFAPSDEAIRLCYEAGSKVFYRLGTSIEHTKDIHFNTIPPTDFHKYADVCAAVVRHYTKGWNNGFKYDMPYWEIWNEPDCGGGKMWTGTQEEFAVFFATVLKRLKDEFPELKIGGPAHCSFRPQFIPMLKAECDKLGVKPDFYSYHMYANNLQTPEYLATEPRRFLDEIGWKGVELCLNEWHFIRAWGGVHSNVTEESYKRTMDARDGLLGINSAAFNIACFCLWHDTPLDSAYYYGCGTGYWGVQRPSKCFNKNYYSLLMMRDMVYDYSNRVAACGGTASQRKLAGLSDDGKKAAVLVADFCGDSMEIPVELKGFENPKSVKCIVLDDVCDNVVNDITIGDDGLYHLVKYEPGSSVFMLLLEK